MEEEGGGGGGGNKIEQRGRRRQQPDGAVRDCYSPPHGGGSVLNFDDGAPDTGDMDHSAYARL